MIVYMFFFNIKDSLQSTVYSLQSTVYSLQSNTILLLVFLLYLIFRKKYKAIYHYIFVQNYIAENYMVVLYERYGNHSNRLIQNMHFEAYCKHYNIPFYNIDFYDIEDIYGSKDKSELYKYE